MAVCCWSIIWYSASNGSLSLFMAVKTIIFSLAFCVNFLFCVPYTITFARAHVRTCTSLRNKHLIYLLCSPACHCVKMKKINVFYIHKYTYALTHKHEYMFYLMHRIQPWIRLKVAFSSSLNASFIMSKFQALTNRGIFMHSVMLTATHRLYIYKSLYI